jgi:hypothetical protein
LEQSEKLPNPVAFFHKSDTIESDTTADFWTPREPKNVEEGPNESESEKNSLFGGTSIEQDEPELSTQNKTQQNRHNLIPINYLFSRITNPQ